MFNADTDQQKIEQKQQESDPVTPPCLIVYETPQPIRTRMDMAEHGLNANSLLVGSLLKQLEDDAAMNDMLNCEANLKPVTPQAALEEHKNAQ